MFKIFCYGSNVLSCSKYFEKLKNFKILLPSELDEIWLKNDYQIKINKKDKPFVCWKISRGEGLFKFN